MSLVLTLHTVQISGLQCGELWALGKFDPY